MHGQRSDIDRLFRHFGLDPAEYQAIAPAPFPALELGAELGGSQPSASDAAEVEPFPARPLQG